VGDTPVLKVLISFIVCQNLVLVSNVDYPNLISYCALSFCIFFLGTPEFLFLRSELIT
jgi:hypothetical protein